MFSKLNLRLVYTIFSSLLIITGTLLAIQYAKGNLRLTKKGVVQGSGLLAANSFPPGAQVFIDGQLNTATDDTLYLKPGTYEIEIKKEGFWPWQKTLQIQQELVTQTNAQLFPIAPSLTPLTFTGVDKTNPSPDGNKIIFYVASSSTEARSGLYTLELSNNLLPFNKQAQQVAFDSTQLFDFAHAQFIWSPDSTQVMVITQAKDVLLELGKKNDINLLPNSRRQREKLLSQWEEEMYLRERQFLAKFPNEIIRIATASAKNVYISPDKKRLLYTATASTTLTEDLVPPVPATNTQPEQRKLSAGNIYIYDREEDKNFLVGQEELTTSPEFTKISLANDLYLESKSLETSPGEFKRLQAADINQTIINFAQYHTPLYSHGLQWFTDSKHLLYLTQGQVKIKEYDNSNDIVIYSGPFQNSFIYPWPDGSRLIILTSFSPDNTPNLYAIEMK